MYSVSSVWPLGILVAGSVEKDDAADMCVDAIEDICIETKFSEEAGP